jgi:phospholipid/cholesterol/gamma-HCH transport system substrate-binding protein
MSPLAGARRAIIPVVIALVVLAAGLTLLVRQGGQKTLVADFPRTVSIYQGSDVRVLGVPVGKVDKVEPEGTDVKVTMHYDQHVQLPADAKAVIVAPSVVGDRYVQITPVYTTGAVLADGATLDLQHTSVPLELDDIYSSLDDLVTALGPNGANKEGALTDLLRSTAANLGGQGAKLHQTITDVGKLTSTLADNKDQLFGSAAQLEQFVHTLASHDGTVRRFTTALDQVSGELAGERTDVAAALKNLSGALGDVTTFVQDNRAVLKTNISGLQKVLAVVAKQRDALDETLTNAPVALNNLFLVYNPDTSTLDTNPNLTEVGDQLVSHPGSFLCGLLGQVSNGGSVCKLVQSLLPRGQALGAGTGSSYGVQSDPTLGGLVPSGGAR